MATLNVGLDTKDPSDVQILAIILSHLKDVRFDIQPQDEAAPKGAAPPAKAKPKVKPPKKTGPKAVADPPKEPAGKPPEKMNFDELAQWIPLQREVTKEMAYLIGAQNKIKHGGVEVIGKALDRIGVSNFKEIKDFKAFVEILIEEDGADVGI